jgi:hypothetical protein
MLPPVTVANVEELRRTLGQPSALARCLARHAYGMRRCVQLIGGQLALVVRPGDLAVAARLVGDNARHMLLFRECRALLGPLAAGAGEGLRAEARRRHEERELVEVSGHARATP